MSDVWRSGEQYALIQEFEGQKYIGIHENEHCAAWIKIEDAPALAKWMLEKCEPKEKPFNEFDYQQIKKEHNDLIHKIAELRGLIIDYFPEHLGEMVGCPYSVVCYAIDWIKAREKGGGE